MARLDGARVNNAVVDTIETGCYKVNGAGVDSAGTGNGTSNDNWQKLVEGIKLDIVISESKTSILVSS